MANLDRRVDKLERRIDPDPEPAILVGILDDVDPNLIHISRPDGTTYTLTLEEWEAMAGDDRESTLSIIRVGIEYVDSDEAPGIYPGLHQVTGITDESRPAVEKFFLDRDRLIIHEVEAHETE